MILTHFFFNGNGTVKGFETLLQKKIDKYTGWVSYTFINSENIYPLLNDDKPFLIILKKMNLKFLIIMRLMVGIFP